MLPWNIIQVMSGRWVSSWCFDGVSPMSRHCVCGLLPGSWCFGLLMCCVLVSVSHALGWRRFGMSWWCVSGDLVASWWSVGDVLM